MIHQRHRQTDRRHAIAKQERALHYGASRGKNERTITRRHTVECIHPPRDTEIDTMSLSASSRYIGLNFPALHLKYFPSFFFTFHTINYSTIYKSILLIKKGNQNFTGVCPVGAPSLDPHEMSVGVLNGKIFRIEYVQYHFQNSINTPSFAYSPNFVSIHHRLSALFCQQTGKTHR